MKKYRWIGVAVVLLSVCVGIWWCLPRDEGRPECSSVRDAGDVDGSVGSTLRKQESFAADSRENGADSTDTAVASSADEAPQTAEEKAAAAEEAKVDAFDNLTDKWMEPSKAGVTMKDVDTFVKTFRNVPENRRDECVHRALNLIPDENVMLLAGVLMDKTMDKEIVETVFNDVLNRDEDVKKPIMKEIYKDRSHPCWADVAWILDVTGENKE